jgi:hypothetical protein
MFCELLGTMAKRKFESMRLLVAAILTKRNEKLPNVVLAGFLLKPIGNFSADF